MPIEVKSSALRRWLREERGRENAAGLAEAIDTMILPGGERLRDIVDWQPEPIEDFGGDMPSAVTGTFSNAVPMEPLTVEHLQRVMDEIQRLVRDQVIPPEYRFRPMSFGYEYHPPLPRLRLDDGDEEEYPRDLTERSLRDPSAILRSVGDPDPKQ